MTGSPAASRLAALPNPQTSGGGAPPGAPPEGPPFHSALESEWARTASAEGHHESAHASTGSHEAAAHRRRGAHTSTGAAAAETQATPAIAPAPTPDAAAARRGAPLGNTAAGGEAARATTTAPTEGTDISRVGTASASAAGPATAAIASGLTSAPGSATSGTSPTRTGAAGAPASSAAEPRDTGTGPSGAEAIGGGETPRVLAGANLRDTQNAAGAASSTFGGAPNADGTPDPRGALNGSGSSNAIDQASASDAASALGEAGASSAAASNGAGAPAAASAAGESSAAGGALAGAATPSATATIGTASASAAHTADPTKSASTQSAPGRSSNPSIPSPPSSAAGQALPGASGRRGDSILISGSGSAAPASAPQASSPTRPGLGAALHDATLGTEVKPGAVAAGPSAHGSGGRLGAGSGGTSHDAQHGTSDSETHDTLWIPESTAQSPLEATSTNTVGAPLPANLAPGVSAAAGAQEAADLGVLDLAGDLQQAIETLHATVELAARRGISQARIALHPQELGAIRIHLTQTAEGLLARVTADTPAAAQALAAGHAELRQSLGALGLNLMRLHIGHEGQLASQSGGAAAGREGERHAETRAGALAAGRVGSARDSGDLTLDTTTEPGDADVTAPPRRALLNVLV
jgi:flagellar hook-length control protein FliK